MRVKDFMRREVVTFQENDPVDQVVDVLVGRRLHGAPVVNAAGELVGVVSQWDIYFGTMTRGDEEASGGAATPKRLLVRDIMTAPAVAASEDTDLRDLCRMMHELHIHRVPIVHDQRVTGIISSLDICRAVAEGWRADGATE